MVDVNVQATSKFTMTCRAGGQGQRDTQVDVVGKVIMSLLFST